MQIYKAAGPHERLEQRNTNTNVQFYQLEQSFREEVFMHTVQGAEY